jgi:hypothetical protein
MRNLPLAAILSLAALLAPPAAQGWVVVRAPVYVAPRPVVVAPAPVYVAPAPVYVAPAPVVVEAAPPPPPPAATEKLPVNTTMWTLPSGCLKVSVNGQELFQCGPNWFRALASDRGTYYAVVPAPQ